ncbi:MerR family transcriptional regulator [Kordiimonas pumila]|uniref:MerR family transcriptional regulator n=1 Tax=Kordiimonas pumila TaxID=2161677 RepID=A0ABV7D2K9_9PROT|nr:MerR family transcriptional regulator [Kordiimonas pumila]
MVDVDSSALPNDRKSREAFRTISEVAEYLDLPQHVLRFWESKFAQIKPLKRGGNRRYYRPDDVALLTSIKKLLHSDGYTIRGVQKLFKAQGVKATIVQAMGEDDQTTAAIAEALLTEQQADEADISEELVDDMGVSSMDNTYKLHDIIGRLKLLRASLS